MYRGIEHPCSVWLWFMAPAQKRANPDKPEKDGVLVAVGSTIRRLREERGVSQEDFAALAGIDRSYYGGIERGERNVATVNLVRIAIALRVEVGNLFPPLEELLATTES